MKTCSLIAILLITACAVYAAEREYFTAAVFEHYVSPGDGPENPQEALRINLNLYTKAAAEAAARDVQIIVFPEYGLFPFRKPSVTSKIAEYSPDPQKETSNPCDQTLEFQDRPILTTFSCLAKNHEMYVVANLVTSIPCDDQSMTCDSSVKNCEGSCPPTGAFMYNTDVAFDKKGNLIARYRKNHLYFEKMNTPANPEYITFKTEFGTFGMIVCFDSVWKHSVNLAENHGVDHVLFPTHWFDDIVPFNAIEWQQSWALANKVNFLAANVHHPALGTLGSGIYSKTFGALTYTYNPDGQSKLLIARVPLETKEIPELPGGHTEVLIVTEEEIDEEEEIGEDFPDQCYYPLVGPAQDNRTDYRCFKSQLAEYSLTKLRPGKQEVQACNNGLCCFLTYSAPTMKEDYYLAAFKGLNDVRGYFKWAEENCILVRCDPFDDKPCAIQPSTANTVFEFAELQAEFTAERVYPTVSKTSYRLVPTDEWQVQTTGNSYVLTYMNKSNEPLLKLGLLGRVYSKDPPFVPFHRF